MITFSDKKAGQFIELISKQRDLYDPNSRYFKSKNKRAKIWEEIAIKCNKKRLTGNRCKILWNKLKRSYAHFKKTGSVVTKRTYAKSKLFELMKFLEVEKKQGNEKKPQANENQQQNNKNVQQDNVNQQEGNENQQQNNTNVHQDNVDQQQGNENQQQTKENRQQGTDHQQQSKENQQQRNLEQQKTKENKQQSKENQQRSENQQHHNKKNIGPKYKNVVKERQDNETKLDPKNKDGFLKDKNLQGLQKISPVKYAASPSSHTLQNAMPPVQLNISGVEINLGSKSNEGTPQTFHENCPAPKPEPQYWPQQKQNEDKSMEDELYLFSVQVRTTLGNLSRELQIEAQNELFRVLSKYKTLALSSMSVSESSSKNTK